MKTFRTLMATVGLLLALVIPTFAQTAVNSTTLAAAVAVTDEQLQLASTTSVSVGDVLVVDYQGQAVEAMVVRSVSSPYVTVSRGAFTTRRVGHANGATVYTGTRARFYSDTPKGTCTRTSETYLPHIVVGGPIYDCAAAGVWYRYDQMFNVSCVTGVLYTSSIDQTCWQARQDYVITAISYVSRVVESGGTLTVIPKRQQGTEAPASGDVLATALSGVSTVAETVTAFTLTTTSADLLLDAGDRLGIDFTDDTAGELAGVIVTFTIAPR